MRILTGKDRHKYEQLIAECSEAQARTEMLKNEVKAWSDLASDLASERDHERKRAEVAIDELLAFRGLAPLGPQIETGPIQQETDPLAEDVAEVARIEKAMQARGVGAMFMESA